jgi:peroxiredoxin
MDRAAKELFDTGQAEGATNVGDIAPGFSLPNATGDTVTLNVLLRVGPVVLSYYRGSWCPYCNLELRTLQANIGAMYESRGHDLIRTNGGNDRTLAIPASYVVGQDGVVSWAFVNSDHTKRAEPSDMIAALDALR